MAEDTDAILLVCAIILLHQSIFTISLTQNKKPRRPLSASTSCFFRAVFVTAPIALLFFIALQPFQELTKELKEILIVFGQLLSGCLGASFGLLRGLLTVGGE